MVKISETYQKFFKDRQSDVGHYFSNLYNIIKFVDKSEIDDKKKYIDILRAQLSSYELLLLFYHSLPGDDIDSFKLLIEKYGLLENIDVKLLIDPPDHVPLCNNNAYGDKFK